MALPRDFASLFRGGNVAPRPQPMAPTMGSQIGAMFGRGGMVGVGNDSMPTAGIPTGLGSLIGGGAPVRMMGGGMSPGRRIGPRPLGDAGISGITPRRVGPRAVPFKRTAY